MKRFFNKLYFAAFLRQDIVAVLRFLVVGGGMSLIYIIGTTIGVEIFDWPILTTNIVFYIIATIIGYLANYFWTFGSTAAHRTAVTKYLTVSVLCFGLNTVFITLVSVVAHIPVVISTTAFMGGWAVISFFLQRNFIYR